MNTKGKKSGRIILAIVAAAATIALIGGVVCLSLTKDKASSADLPPEEQRTDTEVYLEEAVGETETEAQAEASEKKEEEEPVITEQDVNRLRAKVEVQRAYQKEMADTAEEYASIDLSLSEDDMAQFVQEEIVNCYEENIVLSSEIKVLLADGLGADIPDDFATADSAADEYISWLSDQAVGGVLSNLIESDELQEIAHNGIQGIVDGYKESGSLKAAAEGALTSIGEGIYSKLADIPKQKALDFLDEVTNGLSGKILDAKDKVSSFQEMLDYDTSPEALARALSDQAAVNAEHLRGFLEKDRLTGRDIADMMYQYFQYGSILDAISDFGDTGIPPWRENYEKMQTLYQRFSRNETMMRLLQEKEG